MRKRCSRPQPAEPEPDWETIAAGYRSAALRFQANAAHFQSAADHWRAEATRWRERAEWLEELHLSPLPGQGV